MSKINGSSLYLIVYALVCLNSVHFSKTLELGEGRHFEKFSDVYSAAENGDTIKIFNGLYKLNNFIIDKSVSLIGENYPVLSGSEKNQILWVKADSVFISGINFINSGTSFIEDNAAVKLEGVNACKVTNNKFMDNFFGVYLAKSFNCMVTENEIVSNKTRETFSGNGIHLWYCRDIEISGNKISGHRDGIYFEFVKKGKINNNLSEHNLRYGLHFMFSDSCYYGNNIFQFNGAGVAVMYTKYVTMQNNIFLKNWGTASYGLLLKEIYDSKIHDNLFLLNTSAIYLEGCNRIDVRNNIFKRNGWGIKLMGNSMDNRFTLNDFVNNTFDLTTNNMSNFNLINENYWSQQNGYDLNKDGYCDAPYHPVKLFSVIAEQNASLFIFVRSFVVDILDMMESVIPTLTPQNIVDKRPRLNKINDKEIFDTGK